jgi:hypothetical protein
LTDSDASSIQEEVKPNIAVVSEVEPARDSVIPEVSPESETAVDLNNNPVEISSFPTEKSHSPDASLTLESRPSNALKPKSLSDTPIHGPAPIVSEAEPGTRESVIIQVSPLIPEADKHCPKASPDDHLDTKSKSKELKYYIIVWGVAGVVMLLVFFGLIWFDIVKSHSSSPLLLE